MENKLQLLRIKDVYTEKYVWFNPYYVIFIRPIIMNNVSDDTSRTLFQIQTVGDVTHHVDELTMNWLLTAFKVNFEL
jgi:hypothetical protein